MCLGVNKMTLDEAIKWYKDKEAEYRDLAKEEHKNFAMIAEEYQQFAEWLMELKDLREENKFLISEFDRLIKEKGELNELKEKAVLDICRREARLREAKRLLKAAVEDFSEMKPCLSEPYSHLCDKWRYADEALALIGDELNGI